MASGKKIMIIGAGAGQVPIIRASKDRGLITLVVSPEGPYPGIKEADKWIPIDIYDKEAVLAAAEKECIDYVISDQSDFAVPTVAYVAENMGLIGNSIKTAEIFSNKSVQRKFCVENNLSVPISFTLNSERDITDVPFGFPWVIKPADSQGSRGVRKVSNVKEASEAFLEALHYSKQRTVVVEEFFDGREVVCEGFVVEGMYHNIAFADREYFSVPNLFIPSKTIFPSNIGASIKNKLIEHDTKFAAMAGTKFGIMHSEYLVSNTGEFRLVETALRGGGVYISSLLIPESTGIDLTGLLLDYIINGPTVATERMTVSRYSFERSSAYVCFYLKSGVITEVKGLNEIHADENIILAEVDKVTPGFFYPGLKHKGDRLGPFVVIGKTRDELLTNIRCLQDSYKVFSTSSAEDALIWA